MYKKLPSSQPDDKESHPLVRKVPVSNSMLTLVKRRDVWFPFLLCTVNLVGQQAGGLKILQGYQVSIFNDVYRSSQQRNPLFGSSFDYWASVWICFVRFFAALLSAKFINKFRRRTIYLLTASISVLIQITLVFVIFTDSSPRHPWLPILVISLLVFFVQIGPESFPNLICSEVFPSEVRSNGKGIMRAISSVFSFLSLALFPTVKEAIGLDFTFLVLSATLFLCIPVMFLFMPEAKDLNLNYVSQFYFPISNVSYVDLAVNNVPGSLLFKERIENRILMIRNSLGLNVFPVIAGGRILLAEGLLRIQGGGFWPVWTRKTHVFLFNDVLMLATIVTPNIVNIQLKMIPLNNIKLEDKSSSNSWTILHPDHDTVELEACSTEEKVWWIRHITAQLVKLNQEIDIPAIQEEIEDGR